MSTQDELPAETEITANLLLRAAREGEIANWRESDKGFYVGDLGGVEVTVYAARWYPASAFFKRAGQTTVLEASRHSADGQAILTVAHLAKQQIGQRSRGGLES